MLKIIKRVQHRKDTVMKLHPAIKEELEILERVYQNQVDIALDEFAVLYRIRRKNAATVLRRYGIPYTKQGKNITISLLDLAKHRAKRKIETMQDPVNVLSPVTQEDIDNRRGFTKKALEKQLRA